VQAHYAATFAREQGYTAREWRRCLPGAARDHTVQWLGENAASITIGTGLLHMAWQQLPDRQIALMSMARLAVDYTFENVSDTDRHVFMRYFDLFMQRGGG
jgi:hypothetical protein